MCLITSQENIQPVKSEVNQRKEYFTQHWFHYPKDGYAWE